MDEFISPLKNINENNLKDEGFLRKYYLQQFLGYRNINQNLLTEVASFRIASNLA